MMFFTLLLLFLFVSASCSQGSTPLYIACQKGHKDVVEYLLRRGANPHAKFKNKFTPLSIAVQHRHYAIAALLREYQFIKSNTENSQNNDSSIIGNNSSADTNTGSASSSNTPNNAG
jgi:ankyrin repeat protein